MPWWNGVRTYYQWPLLRTPLVTAQMEIERLSVQCRGCGKPVAYLHGAVREYARCTNVRCGGLCTECQVITYAQFRIYDGYLLWEGQRGWYELPLRARWLVWLLNRVRRWFR